MKPAERRGIDSNSGSRAEYNVRHQDFSGWWCGTTACNRHGGCGSN